MMQRKLTLLAVLLPSCMALAHAADPDTTHPYSRTTEDLTDRSGPPMLGIHWTKEFAGSHESRSRGGYPLMTYHGGKIMTTAVTQAIFWGTSWADSNFVQDKITGMDTWYTGFSNSNYAKTSDEYTGNGLQVGPSTSYSGHTVDTTGVIGISPSTILAEVCKKVTSPDPSGNGYYPVYVDVPRGNAGYCAWHSYGMCGSTPVQFAFFFNLDGDPGCDPQDTQTGHSQGLAALANVSGHELSEARSDPASPGAWYDAVGQENGDKCAWTFNVDFVTFPNNSKTTNSNWKIQGEWSNAAYTAGTGYPNSSGQRGCLDGH